MENLKDVVQTIAASRTGNSGLTIVITGANSGIGLVAAKMLALMNPLHRLILVARSLEKARYAKRQVVSVLSQKECAEHIIPLECDHCNLDSVHDFVKQLKRQLDATYRLDKWAYNGIDVLCLNAAILVPDGSPPRFTKDGLETTFQTNHLAPFLIANLLFHTMNPNGRVIFSTSGLHLSCQTLDLSGALDPVTGEVKRGFAMVDGSDFDYKHSYTLAKLCNVATCVELNDRFRRCNKNVIASCFSPGLMLESGLFRHQHEPIALKHQSALLKAKTVEWGAGALVYMAVADAAGTRGGVYWSDDTVMGCSAVYGEHFCPSEVIAAAADVDKRKELWMLSCELADIPFDSES